MPSLTPAPRIRMDSCPFCSGDVSEDLITFGGACPHCLNEIPGEEAATDPGENLKQRQDAADKKQQQRNRLPAVLAGVVGLIAVGGAAIWMLRPAPEVEETAPIKIKVSSLEDHQDLPMAPDEADDSVDQQAKKKKKRRTTPRPETTQSTAGGPTASPAIHSDGNRSAATADPEMPVADNGLADPLAPGALRTGGPGGRFGPQARVLEDMGQIEEMVGKVMARGSKQLKQCYEQRLKSSPDLRGTWIVSFVVTTEGTAANVGITPRGTRDADLEACMKRKVEGWAFSKIATAIDVEQPTQFGSRG